MSDQDLRIENRAKVIAHLGGKCKDCGATEKLDTHHREPASKLFGIGDRLNCKFDTLLEELEKCILLCRSCHMVRHRWKPIAHGTDAGYQRCKPACEACRTAHREDQQGRKEKTNKQARDRYDPVKEREENLANKDERNRRNRERWAANKEKISKRRRELREEKKKASSNVSI